MSLNSFSISFCNLWPFHLFIWVQHFSVEFIYLFLFSSSYTPFSRISICFTINVDFKEIIIYVIFSY
jgi:hypothetical protein